MENNSSRRQSRRVNLASDLVISAVEYTNVECPRCILNLLLFYIVAIGKVVFASALDHHLFDVMSWD